MRKGLLCFFAIAIAVFLLNPEAETAAQKKYRNFSISTGPEKTITSCDQVRLRVDRLEIARSEQERTIHDMAMAHVILED